MNANITVLKDESLGGIEREYREVKRKANAGERIKIVDARMSFGHYANGDIMTITRVDRDGDAIFRVGKRLSNPDGEIFAYADEYVTLEPTDIIRINGDRFRMVDRKAAVGERVITLVPGGLYTIIPVGSILTVEYAFNDGSGIDTRPGLYEHNEYRVLEPVESAESVQQTEPLSAKPAPDQAAEIIAKLTTRVASLERRVTLLEVTNARPIPRRTTKPEQHPSFTKCAVKSPQEIRDDIVKRAKEDVAKLIADARGDNIGAWESIPALVDTGHVTIKFAVDRQKRKVMALAFLRYASDGTIPEFTGRAVCAPGDVFNAHIGRAIALRRALGLEIPEEYVNAPQPTEIRVGDVVKSTNDSAVYTVVSKYDSDNSVLSIGYVSNRLSTELIIIDDSRTDNAEPRKEVA